MAPYKIALLALTTSQEIGLEGVGMWGGFDVGTVQTKICTKKFSTRERERYLCLAMEGMRVCTQREGENLPCGTEKVST